MDELLVMEEKPKTLAGKVKHSEKGYFTLRFKITGGKMTSGELDLARELAERYGRGEVHLTTRQGLEIPWLKKVDEEAISEFVEENGLITGSTGPRLRNVNACPGNTHCRFGQINSPALAEQIDRAMGDWVLPAKLKIAVSGCAHSCAKPQINDIGLIGAVQPRLIQKNCTACGVCVKQVCKMKAWRLENDRLYFERSKCVYCGNCVRSCSFGALVEKRKGINVYVGGKVGREPQIGRLLVKFWPLERVLHLVEGIVHFYAANAEKKERLGQLVNRYGFRNFKKSILLNHIDN